PDPLGRRAPRRHPATVRGRAVRRRDRAGRARRHRLQRDQAGEARDRRRRPGAAVREHRRPDQGRSPRRPLHLARVGGFGGGPTAQTGFRQALLTALRSSPMPVLVDTTIRLLGQEPLAGRMPAADLLQLAEILDGAGFAYLEVSGGGVFDTAVRRGIESPWERIRALNARTTTPLAMALRGRFLVGSRPVGSDFARRFVASAAESGIEAFRLHDPLNDVENLRGPGEAITAAGKEFDAALAHGSGYTGEVEA